MRIDTDSLAVLIMAGIFAALAITLFLLLHLEVLTP